MELLGSIPLLYGLRQGACLHGLPLQWSKSQLAHWAAGGDACCAKPLGCAATLRRSAHGQRCLGAAQRRWDWRSRGDAQRGVAPFARLFWACVWVAQRHAARAAARWRGSGGRGRIGGRSVRRNVLLVAGERLAASKPLANCLLPAAAAEPCAHACFSRPHGGPAAPKHGLLAHCDCAWYGSHSNAGARK